MKISIWWLCSSLSSVLCLLVLLRLFGFDDCGIIWCVGWIIVSVNSVGSVSMVVS